SGAVVVPDRPITVQLANSLHLQVTVIDAETKAALAGVETFVDGRRFQSDAAGHVEVSSLTCGRATSVRTRIAGYANEEKEVLVNGPGTRSVDIELRRATPIEAEVVDVESGAPLPNVVVRDPFHGGEGMRTDGSGRFTTWAAPEHELPVLLS